MSPSRMDHVNSLCVIAILSDVPKGTQLYYHLRFKRLRTRLKKLRIFYKMKQAGLATIYSRWLIHTFWSKPHPKPFHRDLSINKINSCWSHFLNYHFNLRGLQFRDISKKNLETDHFGTMCRSVLSLVFCKKRWQCTSQNEFLVWFSITKYFLKGE